MTSGVFGVMVVAAAGAAKALAASPSASPLNSVVRQRLLVRMISLQVFYERVLHNLRCAARDVNCASVPAQDKRKESCS